MPESPARAARAVARRIDSASAAFARDLARLWRAVERRTRVLLTAPATSGSGLVQAVQAARLRQDMRVALREAGFDALVEDATDAPFRRVAARLLARHGDLAALQASPRLDALRALHQLELLDEGDRAAGELWGAAVRGLYARQPVEAILADLATVIDRTDVQLATLYDTAISIFVRQVELLDVGDTPNARFLYVGPDDAKTREFCEARVNREFTRDEIQAMDNGQIDNVLLSGGGYNCRHLWMQVSPP